MTTTVSTAFGGKATAPERRRVASSVSARWAANVFPRSAHRTSTVARAGLRPSLHSIRGVNGETSSIRSHVGDHARYRRCSSSVQTNSAFSSAAAKDRGLAPRAVGRRTGGGLYRSRASAGLFIRSRTRSLRWPASYSDARSERDLHDVLSHATARCQDGRGDTRRFASLRRAKNVVRARGSRSGAAAHRR